MKKYALLAALLSPSLLAQVQLSPLPLGNVGNIAQFDLTEQGEMVVINQQGELWQVAEKPHKLANNLSTQIAPTARYGRIAAADKQGHFFLWQADKSYTSNIALAPNATMEALAFATIAVSKQKDGYKLVRIETENNSVHVVATSDDYVLPDARPKQINFEHNDHRQGHIAVLAKPDNQTYQHAVLGDDLEAQEIQYLERHTLKPLAKSLSVKGLIFEANQLEFFNGAQPKLVSVMSGNGDGGRAVLVGLSQGKLQIEAQSEPLPSNRWQSPFSFGEKLYAVQMPHLVGKLVEYNPQGQRLIEKELTDGLSNHAYGEYETNLAAVTNTFALIPQRNYREVAILDTKGKVTKLEQTLPAAIQKTKASTDKVYLLLENGQIWLAQEE